MLQPKKEMVAQSVSDNLGYRELKNIEQDQDVDFWISYSRMKLSITQLFVKRYMDPKFNPGRLILKMGTGTGKTLTSLSIAKLFSDLYQRYHNKFYGDKSKNVIVLGFSKPIYIRELLKFPELGFINNNELKQLRHLKKSILESTGEMKSILTQNYNLQLSKIRLRITRRNQGGYFKFFGYKKLFNDLFPYKLDDDVNSYNVYDKYLKGEIKINEEILIIFKDSFLVVDEFHLTYNSVDANNYHLAIQFLSDYYRDKINIVFLSATIINNSKREIIDVANMIKDSSTKHFHSDEFFYSDQSKEGFKKDIQPLINVFHGKTIFLEENTNQYPDVEFVGNNTILNNYIKKIYGSDFINLHYVVMSPLHVNTIKQNGLYTNDASTSNQMLMDMVVPNPDFSTKDIKAWNDNKNNVNPDVIGLYNYGDITEKLLDAKEEWKKEIGIKIQPEDNYNILSGKWLHYDNIGNYSTKAKHMLDILRNKSKVDHKYKCLIYHPYVKGSGILMIGEILKQNGYIEYGGIPRSDTLSAELPITKTEWEKKFPDKPFKPATYFVLGYSVSETKKNQIIDIYNDQYNKYGEVIKIFVGSRKIKQSVDFNNVQLEIVYSVPTNIPELIQIVGRTVRNKALLGLEEDKRKVQIVILVSVFNHKSIDLSSVNDKLTNKHKSMDLATDKSTVLSMELRRYILKIREFQEIQQIEKRINVIAINNFIYGKALFKPSSALGALPYSIKLPKSKPIEKDYYIKNYHEEAMKILFFNIKRAFISCPVWSINDLWTFIKNESLTLDIGLSKKYKDMFDYIINGLIFNNRTNISNISGDIFDVSNIFIDRYMEDNVVRKSQNKVIVRIDDYLISTFIDDTGSLKLNQYSYLMKKKTPTYTTYKLEPLNKSSAADILFSKINKVNMESYKYLFLKDLTSEEHYMLLRDHIEKNRLIPNELFRTYELLKLAGRNWYVDKYDKHVYSNGWKVEQKKQFSKTYAENYVGIIGDKTFRLRKVTDKFEEDSRKVQTGMNCLSKKKSDVVELVKKLNLKVDAKENIIKMCEAIMIHFVKNEIISRNSSEGKRYVLMYNE